jgi:hypothetical protein
VANVEKKLPRNYITDDGYRITASARLISPPVQAGTTRRSRTACRPTSTSKRGCAKKLASEFKV